MSDSHQNPPRSPLQQQLAHLRNGIAIFCGSLIVTLWAAIYHELAYDNAEYAEAAMRNADNLALAFERHVDANVKTIDMALLRLREALRDSPERFDAAARTMMRGPLQPMLVYIGLLDAEGRMTYSTLPSSLGTHLADREYFSAQRDADEDRLYISQTLFGRSSQQWIIPFTRRLEGADGRFAGVISVAVRPDYFSQLFATVDLGINGVATLLRDGDTVLAHGSRLPPTEHPLGKPLRLNPPLTANGTSTLWTHENPLDGVLRVAAYRHHSSYPLAVYVGLARDDALQAYAIHVRDWSIAGILLTLVWTALGIWLLSLQRQLQTMQRASEANETRFRHLYMQAPLAYQLLDADARIIDVNESWTELFGFRAEEVRGCPAADFVGTGSQEAWSQHLATLRERGHADNLELDIRHRDGAARRAVVTSRIDVDADGNRLLYCILDAVTSERTQPLAAPASDTAGAAEGAS